MVLERAKNRSRFYGLLAPPPPAEIASVLSEKDTEKREELKRVANSRARASMGTALLIISVFFLYPSWTMFCLILLAVAVMQALLPSALSVCIMGGLPYGKVSPVALVQKPWWQTLLFPLHADIRSLWTGIVCRKSTHRIEFVGRVRLLLVGDTWYLQCGDPTLGWRVDVRAHLGSPIWRTCYTCPAAADNAELPPGSAQGKWRPLKPGGGGGKKEHDKLQLEVEGGVATAQAWFRKARGLPALAAPK